MSIPMTLTGPDGLPFEADEPAVAAERASRLADELAATAEQLLGAMTRQDSALAVLGMDLSDPVRSARLSDVRRINVRARRSLALLRDCLGEQHVEFDELAAQLRHVLSTDEATDREEDA